MKKNLFLVLGVAMIVLLWLFSRRKVVASTAPVAQGGAVAGGVNFVSVDQVTGLPVFDSTAAPQYIKGLAPDIGGTYTCGNGTVPAVNAENGSVYCVIPAEAGIYSPAAPVVKPADLSTSFVPQGPTQSGGYIGQPNYTPQGPSLPIGTDANGNPIYQGGSSSPIAAPDPVAAAGGTDASDLLLSNADGPSLTTFLA